MTRIAEVRGAPAKDTPSAKAMRFLSTPEAPYREGSDSGRRRIWFDNTGSRFAVTVNRAELQRFVTADSACPIARESYEASVGIPGDCTLWRYC
jgi:hypothetical protein